MIEHSSALPAAALAASAPTRWTAAHVGSISLDAAHTAPPIRKGDFERVAVGLDVWDAWPVQHEDGRTFSIKAGVELWMALAAQHFSDPDERHAHARIHLFERRGSRWHHLGQAMPDGFSPGSREWSGSAVVAPDCDKLTLYFTATGRKGEASPTFGQRMFLARARLENGATLTDWHGLKEAVASDAAYYMDTDTAAGAPGTIKAFRDPAFFRDPADGRRYLFFAGSLAGSASPFNGAIGWAVEQRPDDWATLPPLVSADGLNNELERPHVVHHRGAYYLFWSTQRHVFDPAGPAGPTGLYGMVSSRLGSGWQPLNGTGLVFANPPEAPAQAYSWFVLPDLSVTSFVDDWGPSSKDRPRRFGAAFAPDLHLALDGASAQLAP